MEKIKGKLLAKKGKIEQERQRDVQTEKRKLADQWSEILASSRRLDRGLSLVALGGSSSRSGSNID